MQPQGKLLITGSPLVLWFDYPPHLLCSPGMIWGLNREHVTCRSGLSGLWELGFVQLTHVFVAGDNWKLLPEA